MKNTNDTRYHSFQKIPRSTKTFKEIRLFQEDWDYFTICYRASNTPTNIEDTFTVLDILRAYRANESIPEIASRLNMTKPQIRVRILRAIDIMNKRIENLPEYACSQLLEGN